MLNNGDIVTKLPPESLVNTTVNIKAISVSICINLI